MTDDDTVACALFAHDEETCVAVCRYFMKEFQFTTDSYRLFAAINRLCQAPQSWYTSGPTQKYLLRQIKLMDWTLMKEGPKKGSFMEKATYSAVDDGGRLVINKEMDIALLMLYGHILYSGTSYAFALSRLFWQTWGVATNSMQTTSIAHMLWIRTTQ